MAKQQLESSTSSIYSLVTHILKIDDNCGEIDMSFNPILVDKRGEDK